MCGLKLANGGIEVTACKKSVTQIATCYHLQRDGVTLLD